MDYQKLLLDALTSLTEQDYIAWDENPDASQRSYHTVVRRVSSGGSFIPEVVEYCLVKGRLYWANGHGSGQYYEITERPGTPEDAHFLLDAILRQVDRRRDNRGLKGLYLMLPSIDNNLIEGR